MSGVTIEPDDRQSPQWTKTVFIDGRQLRLQCCEDPTVDGDICIVRCLTDKRLSNPLDPDSVPYQVKPYSKSIGPAGGENNDMEITTFYLQL